MRREEASQHGSVGPQMSHFWMLRVQLWGLKCPFWMLRVQLKEVALVAPPTAKLTKTSTYWILDWIHFHQAVELHVHSISELP